MQLLAGGGAAAGLATPTRGKIDSSGSTTVSDDDSDDSDDSLVPAVFTFKSTLLPDDIERNNVFGASVAVDDQTILIEDSGDEVTYVFTRVGRVWQKQATFEGVAGDVAISGDTALVGPYVFTRSGDEWTRQQQLADGTPAVAVDGETALVGPTVFVRDGDTWTRQADLAAADTSGASRFGATVALQGDTALVGAPGAPPRDEPTTGAVYAFVRDGTTWTQQAKLTAPDATPGDKFGESIDIDGETALVGAPGATHAEGGRNTGLAYLFESTEAAWSHQTTFAAMDAAPGDGFGQSVAIDGDAALVGAPYRDLGTPLVTSFVYAIIRSDGSWRPQELAMSNPFSTYFGETVALDGNVGVIGAPIDSFVPDGIPPHGTATIVRRGFSRDQIAQVKYGYQFHELSGETTGEVEEIANRQPFAHGVELPAVRTRDELAQDRHNHSFDELSRPTTIAIEDEYDAQFGERVADPAYSRDQIAEAKFDRSFESLDAHEAGVVEELFNRQPFYRGVPPYGVETRSELAYTMFDADFETLDRESRIAVQSRFDRQFSVLDGDLDFNP